MYFVEDIDECQEDNACDENAVCENTVGSFDCICKPGYTGPPCIGMVFLILTVMSVENILSICPSI